MLTLTSFIHLHYAQCGHTVVIAQYGSLWTPAAIWRRISLAWKKNYVCYACNREWIAGGR